MGILRFRTKFIAFVLLMFAQNVYSSGFIVGNGGDGVYCRSSDKFPVAGYYFLDYVTTLAYPIDKKSTLKRISDHLSNVSPKLEDSLLQFLKTRTEQSPFSKRVWLATTADLPDIYDENLVHRLPKECRGERISDSPIRQIVVRESKNNRMTFHYSKELMAEIEDKPLQLSYLMIHEWLWDHAKDAETVRILNAYFHSPDFFAADSESLETKLYELGFRFQSNVLEITANAVLRISDNAESSQLFLSQKIFSDSEADVLVLHVYNDSKLNINMWIVGGGGIYTLGPHKSGTPPEDVFIELPKSSSLRIHGITASGDLVPPMYAAEQLYVYFR